MSILAWIVVGAIAGFLIDLVMRTRTGFLMDIVLGIVGALVGGFLTSSLLGVNYATGLNIETLIVAFLGGIVAVLVIRALPGRSPV
jgi:uncharacterized membrane protein YeaQ/YmgE (transglycosylase-associated protein family)